MLFDARDLTKQAIDLAQSSFLTNCSFSSMADPDPLTRTLCMEHEVFGSFVSSDVGCDIGPQISIATLKMPLVSQARDVQELLGVLQVSFSSDISH